MERKCTTASRRSDSGLSGMKESWSFRRLTSTAISQTSAYGLPLKRMPRRILKPVTVGATKESPASQEKGSLPSLRTKP